ncbi:fibroblast growth factor-binding protein 1-like [Dunckerocampus dactyliophorus]|uniref:fibroblast growth factor-binding protein 1-like n=1 Tax=Dunckerocampus dactyliophorus TaxID=161453 RepID=UPI002406BFBE|nr:fibroblast growth factor-binding protein 1-like [Dunckerocampus dactyliophorus]
MHRGKKGTNKYQRDRGAPQHAWDIVLIISTLAYLLHMLKMLQQTLLLASLLALASGAATAAGGRGKFRLQGTMKCTWVARERNRDQDKVRVSVKCEDPVARIHGGVTDMECAYEGRPQSCPAYRSDPKSFWKQVGRSFKRLKASVCLDETAPVRASACKRAPRDAHFRLDISSSVSAAQSGGIDLPPGPTRPGSVTAGPLGPTPCPETQRRAEEYCGSTWANLCTFFMSVLQKDAC